MTMQAGIWMDHAKAIAVVLNGEHVDVSITESGAKAPTKSSGGHHQVSPYSHQDVVAEDHRKHRFEQDMDHYYDRILQRIKTMSEVILLGPGQAKKEFRNRLREDHPSIRIRQCKSMGDMTSGELTRYVCKFFHHEYV